jgi:hypothetical protein
VCFACFASNWTIDFAEKTNPALCKRLFLSAVNRTKTFYVRALRKMLLRIEYINRERSTDAAIAAMR